MTEVLDPNEVNALLDAVAADADGDEFDFAGDRRRQGREVTEYDFKRPERVSKEQMRALQSIHESFARSFGASLSAFLRTIVETHVATTEQLTYSEFIHSLPSPTCFNLLSAETLTGKMCLEISPLIVFPIIDRLLGGTNSDIFIPQRPLTIIEQRLVNRILDRALENLSDAWSELVEVKFDIAGHESNPHLVQIVAPNEVVVVVGFELKVGARAGTMSICIPFNVIEPVIGKLATQSWLAYSRGTVNTAHRRAVTQKLRTAEINLRAYLGHTRITLSDLMSLAPGDLIRLDKLVTEEMGLQVEGRDKFIGRLGQLRGNRAFRLTKKIEEIGTV